MAVDWSASQRTRVAQALEAYPLNSSRCEDAAAKILRIARERDHFAKRWRLAPPRDVPCIVPKTQQPWPPWRYHVLTEVSGHYVDVLTGPNGTRCNEYLDDHWLYPEEIYWEAA